MLLRLTLFQSTPPARGATQLDQQQALDQGVSIHAPRAGGDMLEWEKRNQGKSFNPRPPRGGRLVIST